MWCFIFWISFKSNFMFVKWNKRKMRKSLNIFFLLVVFCFENVISVWNLFPENEKYFLKNNHNTSIYLSIYLCSHLSHSVQIYLFQISIKHLSPSMSRYLFLSLSVCFIYLSVDINPYIYILVPSTSFQTFLYRHLELSYTLENSVCYCYTSYEMTDQFWWFQVQMNSYTSNWNTPY